jgi:hypothetical protein
VARAAGSVVAELCRRIVAGELRPGATAPSGEDLARELGVTVGAADHALLTMRHDGLVEDAADGPGPVITEQAPEIASKWPAASRRRAPSRGSPQLLALIVRTAIELADADGLAVTSMRRIAGQLDMDFMALRRSVHDRDHLEILMADAVFAEHPPPQPPTGDWRTQLDVLCRAQLLLYRRHPWLAEAVSFRQPLLGPHVAGHIEWAVRALIGAGPAPQTAGQLATTAANFVRGHAMSLAQAPPQDEHGPADGGVRRDAALFEFGLQRLLDGFARLVAEPPATTVPVRRPVPARD